MKNKKIKNETHSQGCIAACRQIHPWNKAMETIPVAVTGHAGIGSAPIYLHCSSLTFAAMNPMHLGWLLIAPVLVWLKPWQAKQLFPAVCGSFYIQWASKGSKK